MQTPKAERHQMMIPKIIQVIKNPYSCAECRNSDAGKVAFGCLGALSVSADFCLRTVFHGAQRGIIRMPAFLQCFQSALPQLAPGVPESADPRTGAFRILRTGADRTTPHLTFLFWQI